MPLPSDDSPQMLSAGRDNRCTAGSTPPSEPRPSPTFPFLGKEVRLRGGNCRRSCGYSRPVLGRRDTDANKVRRQSTNSAKEKQFQDSSNGSRITVDAMKGFVRLHTLVHR